MKKILFLFCFAMSLSTLSAQRYDKAIGLRVGNGSGITYQMRVSNRYTVETILQTDLSSKTDLIGLGQYHGRIFFQKRINWYTGGGLHLGSERDNGFTFGPAIIFGLEMSVNSFNISADYLMMNYMLEHPKPYQHYGGVSVRYIFQKRKRKKINLKFWEWGRKKKKK